MRANRLKDFIDSEAASALPLLAAAGLALVLANSPFAGSVQGLLDTRLGLSWKFIDLSKPLVLWINDGLMALFFLLVGLEIKREVVEGSLMLATQTMLQVGLPFEKVLATLRAAREERYQLVPGFFHGATDEGSAASGQERLRTLVVSGGAACCGKTLRTLNLPMLGVTITAMRRANAGDVTAMDEERLLLEPVPLLESGGAVTVAVGG